MIQKATRIPIILFLICTLFYALFEITERSHIRQIETDPALSVEESLDTAHEIFSTLHNSLKSQTREMKQEIEAVVQNSGSRQLIHQALQQPNLWGAMLLQNDLPFNWWGFHLTAPPVSFADEADEAILTTILRRNNVVYLLAQAEFSHDDNRYRLLTAERLQQETNLPFAAGVSFDLVHHASLDKRYPVQFSFFTPPQPESYSYRVLSTTLTDSAGVVYANHADLSRFLADHANWLQTRRAYWFLALFGFGFLLFCTLMVQYRSRSTSLVQLGLILAGWYITYSTGAHTYLLQAVAPGYTAAYPDVSSQASLYLLHTLFLSLLALFTVLRTQKKKAEATGSLQLKGVLMSLLLSGIAATVFLFAIIQSEQLLAASSIPLLDLQLIPNADTFLFFITCALLFTAVGAIIASFTATIFAFEHDKSILIFAASLFGFVIAIFAIDFSPLVPQLQVWHVLLISFLFVTSLGLGWAITNHREAFEQMSGFRRMVIGIFLLSVAMYTIIWQVQSDRQDAELRQAAIDYAGETASDGREMLRDLLIALERRMQFLSAEDFEQSQASVQVQFQRAIQANLPAELRDFQYDLQLIRADGEQISDFSTSLESPGWTALFNTDLMVAAYRGEQLSFAVNRPVIQGRPSGVPEDFRSFYRGWIPIFDTETAPTIVAWIFGSIYQERADFNKPLRAVLAAATGDEWKRSYYLAEFTDGRVNRSAVRGIYSDQPEYNRLSETERSIADRQGEAFVTAITARGTFREMLLSTGAGTVVKASTPMPGFNNYLFSYFRLQMVLVFFGLFLFALFSLAGLEWFRLFGQSRRFQNRLIDGLTLATLLFLTALIFATQYAVGNQNEKQIERELVTKLKTLGDSVRGDVLASQSFNITLNEHTAPINVDAILYRNVWVHSSTTPQIFQQHLLPRILPYSVYDFLYNRERRHVVRTASLGGEDLLIGYRAIMDDENNTVGAIAIPTFVQSPVYTEQLLETTSYLFGIYLAIFLLFIIGSVMLSNRLTRPLQLIQRGLNKISRGESKSTIDVSSRDEIGTLAAAYNQMVARLDEAQKELIKAERESAWKEMAQQVAHEIKNPLTPMKLNLQHLQRQLEANPDNVLELKPAIEKTAANIIEQIESLSKIASDFSTFAKPISEPMEKTDMRQLIDSVEALYRADDQVTIQTRFQQTDLSLHCVRDEIRRVLINLVKNGIEATPDGQKPVVTLAVEKEKESLLISVRDGGSGIPEENRPRIFVPNFSTKSSGTGLGLAISKKIVEAHQGTIWFETETGRGTTFYLRLPVLPDSEAAPRPADRD
ncbi:MAG: sensor histidine kinase [Balneolaceae bacterium]